jgi:CRP-like cAMP-binding protein
MPDVCDDDRRAQMFPVLTDAQIARVELHATRRPFAAGETTFELGTADPGIHVVLSGVLEVVRPGAAGDDLVTALGAGQFTGEVRVVSPKCVGRRRAAEAGAETYRVFIGRIFISRVMSITYVHSARIG